MNNITKLIEYFKEYDFYDNILSTEVKDKNAKDVLLENCNFTFISANMVQSKSERIFQLLKKRLDKGRSGESRDLIHHYINHRISHQELFQRLPFLSHKFLDSLKDSVNNIEKNRSFFVFYPVLLSQRKRTQQPLFTFSYECLEETVRIQKVYANKNVLALLIAQKKEIELTDAKVLYSRQIDKMAAAVDALHSAPDIFSLYQIICGEFRNIFDVELKDCGVSGNWQMLNKALVSFESADAVIENCFCDEMETVERFYRQDGILPETIQRYLGLSASRAKRINEIPFDRCHMGSYQAAYPVNRKQWQLMQLAEKAKILCVEGPPGTGKTTLLKEMIADALVHKADTLLSLWDKPWKSMGTAGKGINCSPLMGNNPHSIVISSTNNKAIDNIGMELLQEVPFFSEFADTINEDGMKYSGILCARIGNSKNIEDFYTSFFQPFCAFLHTRTITREESEVVKKHYTAVRAELNRLNHNILDFLSLQGQMESYSAINEIKEKQLFLENKFKELMARKREKEEKCLDCQKVLDELKIKKQEADWEVHQLKQRREEVERQLAILYSDLKEYESITGFKKLFVFLYSKAKEVKKKYGSEKQIYDLIHDWRERDASLISQMDNLQRGIAQSEEKQLILSKEVAGIQLELLENGADSETAIKRYRTLEIYLKSISELEQELEIPAEECLKADAFHFFSQPKVITLRNQCYLAALSLFESYVILHKEPILENLGILLTTQERDGGGTYYNWCNALYNGDTCYPKEKAALVRMLWETFFLCFPVVTTTLHSFRKTTFQMVPGLFDMLLIDEGGQIVPYYVLAPLYRAGRAVFVGDVNQIEPIKSASPKLMEKKYIELLGEECYSRFCLDSASAQSYAAKASDFCEAVGDTLKGVVLTEHRRCEPAIMAFSNKYVYGHVLDLLGTDDNKKVFGSNLVAFDIRGFKTRQHYNTAEIQACQEIVRLLVETYGNEVKKDIGIITPFSKQAEKLRESIPGVETGTVHVFQGAEKKYILFSCVIDTVGNQAGLYNFIGGKCNLLNVAFSRAKEQFIFVGNLQAAQSGNNYLKKAVEVLNESGKVFSFFSADQLADANRLPDKNVIRILSGAQHPVLADEIGRYLRLKIPKNIIDTPQMHNEILNDMISMATQSVHIISPWIGRNVVTDHMMEVFRDKIQNGVQIQVIFGYKAVNCSLDDVDELVEHDIPWGKEAAADVIRRLRKILGNRLRYLPPSHVKLLLVDDKYLFIGSLNWLYNSGKAKQKEISYLLTNPDTIQYVKAQFVDS